MDGRPVDRAGLGHGLDDDAELLQLGGDVVNGDHPLGVAGVADELEGEILTRCVLPDAIIPLPVA